MKKEPNLQGDQDRHLDVPGEANRDKHINFREEEDKGEDLLKIDLDNEEVQRRKKEWQKGIEDGNKERNKQNPE